MKKTQVLYDNLLQNVFVVSVFPGSNMCGTIMILYTTIKVPDQMVQIQITAQLFKTNNVIS